MSTIERVLFWDFEQFFDLALSFLVIKLTRRRILREKVFTKDVITLYGALHEHLLGGDINVIVEKHRFLKLIDSGVFLKKLRILCLD